MISINGDIKGLDNFEKEVDGAIFDEAVRILTNIGEDYINTAKSKKGKTDFTDRSDNLRNAHSYIIYNYGERIAGVIGRTETLQMFESIKDSSAKLQFIVGDGMNYASFVEGKGFDVCTSGFMMVEREVREKFKVV